MILYLRTLKVEIGLLAGALLFGCHANAADTPCKNNTEFSFSQYLTIASDINNWDLPLFTEVPKDVNIVDGENEYLVDDLTGVYLLPSEMVFRLAGYGPTVKVHSHCTVKASDGSLWVVERAKQQLMYVPLQNVKLAKPLKK